MVEYEAFTGETDKDGKTHWTRIGVVFRSKSGNGLSLKLNALPLANEKGCWVALFPPKAREEQKPPQRPAGGPDFDDEVPF